MENIDHQRIETIIYDIKQELNVANIFLYYTWITNKGMMERNKEDIRDNSNDSLNVCNKNFELFRIIQVSSKLFNLFSITLSEISLWILHESRLMFVHYFEIALKMETWLNNNCEKYVEGNVFDFCKTIIFIYSRNEILWKKGEF